MQRWQGMARQDVVYFCSYPERKARSTAGVPPSFFPLSYLHMPTVEKPPAFPNPVKRAHASSSPRNARMLGWGHHP